MYIDLTLYHYSMFDILMEHVIWLVPEMVLENSKIPSHAVMFFTSPSLTLSNNMPSWIISYFEYIENNIAHIIEQEAIMAQGQDGVQIAQINITVLKNKNTTVLYVSTS